MKKPVIEYADHMDKIQRKDIRTALSSGTREIKVEIQEEMKDAYLDYAMSVIIGRAIPDVRDGLKPVHRRILYAMYARAWRHDKPFVKSAKIVGEVIGNYHPHGDGAVYDSLVRMSQDFAMSEVLIQGQGNFGSIDGDNAAAYRYTEARLSKIASEMLNGIDKNTVDFIPNYDGSRIEPTVLPSSFPNLLVNGSNGIAVGMATSIPPHNLSEVVAATRALIENPEITISELMEFIQGPDFPTGGVVIGKESLKKAYHTGRASILVRAKIEIIENPKKKNEVLVVKEIPYQVNKSKLLERIAELVQKKVIDGIVDMRDLSNREGIRVECELRKGANAQIVLNQLYKLTQLQESFSFNFLALSNGKPEVFNLKVMLQAYIAHHKEIIIRRTQYLLDIAQKQAHILEGLKIALDFIDETIRIIRSSKTVEDANQALQKRFKLSPEQTKAILEMRLQKLTSLEISKILEELKILKEKIVEYQMILKDEKKQYGIVDEELSEVGRKFPTKRRTTLEKVSRDSVEFEDIDLIPNEPTVVLLSQDGFIRRVKNDTFRKQKRGGRGVKGQSKSSDSIRSMIFASTHDTILLFSNKGKIFAMKAYELPETSRDSRGKSLKGLVNLSQNEEIYMFLPITGKEENKYLIIATKRGFLKKMKVSLFYNVKKNGILAIGLRPEDSLQSVCIVNEEDEVFIATQFGNALRMKVKNLRSQGRTATGVVGMRLSKDDKIIGMNIVTLGSHLFVATAGGYGKRVSYDKFTPKNKGTKGMLYFKKTGKTGPCICITSLPEDSDILLMSEAGMTVRVGADEVSILGRTASGVKMSRIDETDILSNIVCIPN